MGHSIMCALEEGDQQTHDVPGRVSVDVGRGAFLLARATCLLWRALSDPHRRLIGRCGVFVTGETRQPPVRIGDLLGGLNDTPAHIGDNAQMFASIMPYGIGDTQMTYR